MSDFDFNNINDLKTEEKRLYEEYKAKLAEIKKVQKEKEAVGQVFTKGLLPIYVLHILKSGPTNGNEISTKISERTNGLWTPSTGGIYPLLKKLEKDSYELLDIRSEVEISHGAIPGAIAVKPEEIEKKLKNLTDKTKLQTLKIEKNKIQNRDKMHISLKDG